MLTLRSSCRRMHATSICSEVGYRSDATNTNIWHRKKLHVCEATVTYLTDVKKLQEGSFDAAMSSRSCVLFGCSFMGCTRGHPQNYEVTKVT